MSEYEFFEPMLFPLLVVRIYFLLFPLFVVYRMHILGAFETGMTHYIGVDILDLYYLNIKPFGIALMFVFIYQMRESHVDSKIHWNFLGIMMFGLFNYLMVTKGGYRKIEKMREEKERKKRKKQ